MTLRGAPVATVTLFLDLPFDGGDLFTIEDPVLGLIQTGGEIPGDLGTTTLPVYDLTIRRGRGRALDDIDVGTASVAFRNYDRDWDPLNTASSNASAIRPGRQVNIDIYGQRIFTGYVDDWQNTYTFGGEAVGVFPAIDGLGILGRQAFDAWTATASQQAGARIDDILSRSEVAWSGGRALDAGASTLQGDTVTWGSNPLNYVQLVAKTDQGYAFVDRNGVFTYKDRISLIDPTPVETFADDGTGLPFRAATLTGSGERFYTQVSVDRFGGTVQTASDDSVGASSAIRRLPLSQLLMDNDEEALGLAQWLLSLYSDPEPKVRTLTVLPARFDTEADAARVMALDIGSVIHVTWTPLGLGSTIDEDYTIESVEHSIPYSGLHSVTFSLAPVTQQTVFTIEDELLGLVEGVGRIAF